MSGTPKARGSKARSGNLAGTSLVFWMALVLAGIAQLSQSAMAPKDYSVAISPAEAGQVLFNQFACATCHDGKLDKAQSLGPKLGALVGSKRRVFDDFTLTRSKEVTVDDAYLRDSILNPNSLITEGYQPVMPPYKKVLQDSEVAAIIAYIKTIPKGQ